MARYRVQLSDGKRSYAVSMMVKGNDLAQALKGVTLTILSKTRVGKPYQHDKEEEVLMMDVGKVTVYHV